MSDLTFYTDPAEIPASVAARVGRLLDLDGEGLTDISLARRISAGLPTGAATALGAVLGQGRVIGPLIPEATFRRTVKASKPLSRELSERLYEVGRVVDAVSRVYHGDKSLVEAFLTRPHPLLDGDSPLEMASSSSAGADAVLNLIQGVEAGFAV
ncbi:MAG: antitoxin Xre/MbcA/ParS toxin-binding domain-containing protein [Pseudomonadota bacterium]